MKVKENYITKKVLDNDIVIDITGKSKKLIKLNETASFMFEKLQEGINNSEELIQMVLDNYDIDKDIVSRDVNELIDKLKELNILDD